MKCSSHFDSILCPKIHGVDVPSGRSWVKKNKLHIWSIQQVLICFPNFGGTFNSLSKINNDRRSNCEIYRRELTELAKVRLIELPHLPDYASNNGFMFYLNCRNLEQSTTLISALRKSEIGAVFHYVPLHSSLTGLQFGVFLAEKTILSLCTVNDCSDCHFFMEYQKTKSSP